MRFVRHRLIWTLLFLLVSMCIVMLVAGQLALQKAMLDESASVQRQLTLYETIVRFCESSDNIIVFQVNHGLSSSKDRIDYILAQCVFVPQ